MSFTWRVLSPLVVFRIDLSFDVEEDHIISRDLWEDRAADSEEEGDFTGNESMPSKARYHDTVCLLAICARI